MLVDLWFFSLAHASTVTSCEVWKLLQPGTTIEPPSFSSEPPPSVLLCVTPLELIVASLPLPERSLHSVGDDDR